MQSKPWFLIANLDWGKFICLWVSVLLVSFTLGLSAVAQDRPPKPKLSAEPMTEEQIAVYRAVLNNYMEGSTAGLNVSNVTEPFDLTGLDSDKNCAKGFDLKAAENSASTIHKLSSAIMLNSKMVLVDPEQQETKIKQNDPQNLLKKGIDNHERISGEQADQSVRSAFSTGLFRLSEIIFDRRHHHAIVSYSFDCGMLCGNAGVLVLEKRGDEWKISKTCVLLAV